MNHAIVEFSESETMGGIVNESSAMARKGDQDMLPTTEDFQAALDEMFAKAQSRDDGHIDIRSGDLHRLVGGYPGRNHRMPKCCGVRKEAMGRGM